MKDTDRILIGTSWTRSGKQQHSPTVGIIDSIGSRGPRLKAEHKYHRLVWAELGFSWTPADRSSEKAYDLWQLAARVEYLDEKLEASPTESETIEVAENGVLTMDHPETSVRECHGAWHKHGKIYELVPLSKFSVATRGPNTGQLAAVCDDCKNRHKQEYAKTKAPKVEALPASIVVEPGVQTETGTVYRWKVTVIQETAHYVQGKDFLDAAAQLSGTGEIVKVEKL